MADKYTFECYLTYADGGVGDSYKDNSGYPTEWDCQNEAIIQARELYKFYEDKGNNSYTGVVIYIQKNGEDFKEIELDSDKRGSLMVMRGTHVGDSKISDSEEEMTKGSLVKYKDILAPGDETSRFVITEDKGNGKVEVKDITSLTSFGFSTYLRMKNEFIPVTDRDDINNCLELIKKGSKPLYLDVLDKLEDTMKVSDSVNTNEFIENFEPYLIDEEVMDDYNAGRYPDLYLSIGDRNSDVILYVIVSNITANGGFDSEIDDVENLEVDTDFFNDELYETIYDFISSEVVFDETH